MANTLTRRDHAGAATTATITGSMSTSDTTFTLSTNAGWPTGAVGPFFVCIDAGTGSEEKLLIQAQAASVCTVAASGRGVDGTIAKTHALGASVYVCWSAAEADELNAHGAAVSGVHGVAGSVVGNSDTQTLTNKTISGASNTFSAIPESAVTNLTTDLAAKQPLAANLTTVAGYASVGNVTALAGIASGGLYVVTGVGSAVTRSLAAGSSAVSITNANGGSGNPTVDVVAANFTGIPQSAVTGLVADLTSRQRIVHVYTAGTTWTKPAAANFLGVFTIGTAGGGGGGGVPAPGAGSGCAASGGGAANTVMAWIPAASLSATETVTIGAAGTAGITSGGTSLANSGGNGGSTSFGSHFTANGGQGGSGDSTGANAGGHSGGPQSGAGGGTFDISLNGGGGGAAIKFPSGACSIGGGGGASFWGGGGVQQLTTSTTSVAGDPAACYGAGGGGGAAASSGGAAGGGAAAGGVMYVAEIYG